jgi:hypothetical protein
MAAHNQIAGCQELVRDLADYDRAFGLIDSAQADGVVDEDVA